MTEDREDCYKDYCDPDQQARQLRHCRSHPLPMAPSRVSLPVPTMHSLPYLPYSPKLWLVTSPSWLPILLPGYYPQILSRTFLRFLLNNPIAFQKKHLKLKDGPNMKKIKTDLRNAVKAGEKTLWKCEVELCDWSKGLEPLPTMEMLSLHRATQDAEARIGDALSPMDQVTTEFSPCLHLRH